MRLRLSALYRRDPALAAAAIEAGDTGPVLFRFRWWYKGQSISSSPNSHGDVVTILRFEGYTIATDEDAALSSVENQMRAKHPEVRWMHGTEIEGDGVTFGPTVRKLKKPYVGDFVDLSSDVWAQLKSRFARPSSPAWPPWALAMATHRAPGDRGVGDTLEHEVGIIGSPAFAAWFRRTIKDCIPCPNCPAQLNRRFPYL